LAKNSFILIVYTYSPNADTLPITTGPVPTHSQYLQFHTSVNWFKCLEVSRDVNII